jgi:hypothetical protein
MVAQITDSTFVQNEALGGSNASATGTDILGIGGAEGGAIYNEVGSTLTVSGCALSQNQAVGGSDNTGSAPVALVGYALGGGIVSAYGGVNSIFGVNALTVTNCSITGNEAQGGHNNSGSASVAGLIGTGGGGGVTNYAGGTAGLTGSLLFNNTARGGTGNSDSGGGGLLVDGAGLGGGIFNFLGGYNSSGYGQFDTSTVTLTNCLLIANKAQGGAGGNGEGGGIANLFDASTTLYNSVVAQDLAVGGSGAGLGGGAYNDATSTLALTGSLVTGNLAVGATGIGGGVYTVGTFTEDPLTVVFFNHASTSDNNVGP